MDAQANGVSVEALADALLSQRRTLDALGRLLEAQGEQVGAIVETLSKMGAGMRGMAETIGEVNRILADSVRSTNDRIDALERLVIPRRDHSPSVE